MSNLTTKLTTASESFYHKAMKQMIYKSISGHNKKLLEYSKEKSFNENRADVYFKFKDGKEVVVEVQHSQMTIKELKERTKNYNDKGIHVLWVLHGKGNCVGSKREPENAKTIRINAIEKFLHQMYGGRVYYINVNESKERVTVTPPFAIHYSLSTKVSPKGFKENFQTYYLRNACYKSIPNWDLLCVEYRNLKIARFYDKNVKSLLKDSILGFIERHYQSDTDFLKFRKTTSLLKLLLHFFGDEYGEHLVLDIIEALSKSNKITIKSQVIKKWRNKLLK